MNVLAIMAHPDDVEEMCCGTLQKYRERGDEIYVVLSTSGNIGSKSCASKAEIAAVREAEALAAARFFDAKVKFLHFDDELLMDTQETRQAFLDAIRWARPDVIFTHDPSDTSPDHNMTARMVLAVLQILDATLMRTQQPPVDKAPSVFFCDIPGGIDFHPEIYVDISPYMEDKLRAIHCHKSQIEWMGQFLAEEYQESVQVQSRFRGYQCGCKYAEGFRAHRILGYVADYRLLP